MIRLNIMKIEFKVLKSYIFSTKVANFQINEIETNKCIIDVNINIQKL